jgi:hypothetical protein
MRSNGIDIDIPIVLLNMRGQHAASKPGISKKTLSDSTSRRQGPLNFLIHFVLAQRENRPGRRRHPTDQRDLKQQADDPSERTTDGEELKPGNNNGKQETHGFSS